MAIKWGSTWVTAVKWGSTNCTAVYWGSTKVFPGGGNGYNGSTFDYPFQSGFTNNQTSGTITSGTIEFNLSNQFKKNYRSWNLLTSVNDINFSNYSTITVAWTETYGSGTQGTPDNYLSRRIYASNPSSTGNTVIGYNNNGVAVTLNDNMKSSSGKLNILYGVDSSITAWVYWAPFKITKILLS